MTTYRADIDGLRAIAVLVVVLYHAGFSMFGGGFVGVDVFFVISGFVITRRLLDDVHSNRFSITDFYVRRVRRILPALFIMVLLTWLISLFLLMPAQLEDLSKSTVATAFFASNVYFWRSSGYFDVSALSRPLLHTWSLAVEEQYYIVMPLAIYVVARFGRQRWGWFFIPAVLASLALSIAATNVAATANFFLLPTRAWEILLGALLVLVPLRARLSSLAANALGAAGLCLIAWAVLAFSEETPFPGYNALIPCIGAALLIYAGGSQTGTLTQRLLSVRPLVGIGLISYSMYLVHWPMIVLYRQTVLRDFSLLESAALVAASVALACLSYRFVEQPFRYSKPGGKVTPIFAAALGSALVVGAVGISGVAAKGFPQRFPDFIKQDVAGYHEWLPRTCFLLAGQNWRDWNADACRRTHGHSRNMLLWGDSFAAHYVPGLIRQHDALRFNVVQYTAAGCRPTLSFFSYALPLCQEFNSNVLSVIKSMKIDSVIIAARWSAVRARGFADLQDTIEALGRLGVRVYVIGQSPEFPVDVQTLAYRDRSWTEQPNRDWPLTVDPQINAQMREAVAGTAVFIDPLAKLCEGKRCPYMRDGRFLFEDSGHFSAAGSVFALKRFVSFGAFAN